MLMRIFSIWASFNIKVGKIDYICVFQALSLTFSISLFYPCICANNQLGTIALENESK